MSGPSFAEGLVGITLDGRYRLDAVLGEGGMGSVFRAQHLAMDRRVAVKLLKPHLTSDEVALRRFAAEARRTLRVDSPHAVKVLDFGVTQTQDYYIVLEYLDGRTVQRELEVDGPFAPARVIHIARQALHALGASHASGLVHRDIKPENLLLMRSGDDPDYAKVLDFGVAKLMQGATVSDRSAFAMTAKGMVFGTPEFMSPEQACGLPLDGRSDLYSLAATMFAMLTGCGLFDAATPIAWLTAHARKPPPHLAQLDANLTPFVGLDALLQRCLAKRPDQRPADAAVMAAELADLVSGTGAPAAAATARKAFKTMFSESGFIEAFADGPTTLPPASTGESPALTTGGSPVAPRSRRGLYVGLAVALAAVGLIATTIVVAARGHDAPRGGLVPVDAAAVASAREALVDAAPARVIADDAAVAVAVAPIPTDARVAAAPIPADARVVAVAPVRPDAGVVHVAPRPPSEAELHLRAAEEAQRTGNRLRQMSEADAARRLDPSNAKAIYLLADVLITSGDPDRGCAYLRTIKHFPLANTRARSAGCGD